jgi:hypothetical protein
VEDLELLVKKIVTEEKEKALSSAKAQVFQDLSLAYEKKYQLQNEKQELLKSKEISKKQDVKTGISAEKIASKYLISKLDWK